MKFPNLFETDTINVTGATLYDHTPCVWMTSSAGSLQFIFTMSPEQARVVGEYLIELADNKHVAPLEHSGEPA